jgi:excisionase family DNA binding protein
MADRVLIALPDGRWLALSPEAFHEALAAGAALSVAPATSSPDLASAAEQLLEAEELATVLKLPVTWLEQAAREQRIPSIQAGRWRRFKRSAVERALAANGSAR